MKQIYLSLMGAIAKIEDYLCYTGIIVCSMLIVFQVLNRYMLHFEIMWISDLALYLYIPTGICCIAVTAREDAHTSVDVFVDMAFKNNEIARKVYKIFITILVLAIFIYFIPMANVLFKKAWRYPEYGTLVRWYNTSWNREFLALIIGICFIHTLHNFLMHIGELRTMLKQRSHTSEKGASL